MTSGVHIILIFTLSSLIQATNRVHPALRSSDLLTYVLSSTALVKERVLRGQLQAWAAPLANAARFYVVIEDGPEARSLALELSCTLHVRNSLITGIASRCRQADGMSLVLATCQNLRWGENGPCCKAEAALLHHANYFGGSGHLSEPSRSSFAAAAAAAGVLPSDRHHLRRLNRDRQLARPCSCVLIAPPLRRLFASRFLAKSSYLLSRSFSIPSLETSLGDDLRRRPCIRSPWPLHHISILQ